ncbi:MAG: hypothetical protein QOK15_2578 [Nocardioidaceae bacterium]|nr:hypothetical protein [Nocardioidaceae bacterium]
MGDEAEKRRAERAERAAYHSEARQRREELESAKAQVLIERFVAQALQAELPTEELTARPWSGRGRYRTGVVGWYLRRDRSLGVGVDGSYYVLNVPTALFGRWRTVHLDPTPPPLEIGKGARDGEAVSLDTQLQRRLQWTDSGE